ncbi:MAG: methyltransferase domain-containing protein [Candidatus Saccharibacteria bacterium]|nr:methyltransferase domain-containing protein [Candidatus Saccharibacteria bacterium]
MNKNPVIRYYHSAESKFGYRLLKGVKHFGYYPKGKENIPMLEAQMIMNEQLAKRLELEEGKKVLDAGCGEGNVALYLAKHHGLNVEGIDLLEFNIKNAKENSLNIKLTNSTSFQVGNYLKLPFRNDSFDAIYTMETLVHAPDYHKALIEFYRVLKPNGKLVLFEYTIKPETEITPSEREAMNRIKQINQIAAMPAFNEFTFGSMKTKLNKAGFRDVSTENITARMLPMLKQLYLKAKYPYKLFRILHLENHLINGMSAVEFYENQNLWRYEITTAIK